MAAIADAHSLESVGYEILKPLKNKQFNSSLKTNRLPLIVDGNLKSDLLNNLAADSFYEKFDLKLVPASPGKASRLTPFITKGNVTLYLNLSEAQIKNLHKTIDNNKRWIIITYIYWRSKGFCIRYSDERNCIFIYS